MIADLVTKLRRILAGIFGGSSRKNGTNMPEESDVSGERLAGYTWHNDITDDSDRETGPLNSDSGRLADTLYRARPSNPLSDDR